MSPWLIVRQQSQPRDLESALGTLESWPRNLDAALGLLESRFGLLESARIPRRGTWIAERGTAGMTVKPYFAGT